MKKRVWAGANWHKTYISSAMFPLHTEYKYSVDVVGGVGKVLVSRKPAPWFSRTLRYSLYLQANVDFSDPLGEGRAWRNRNEQKIRELMATEYGADPAMVHMDGSVAFGVTHRGALSGEQVIGYAVDAFAAITADVASGAFAAKLFRATVAEPAGSRAPARR